MPNLCYPTFYSALEAIGVTVKVIEKNEDTWGVQVNTTIHKEKEVILSHSFSKEFTHEEVLHDSGVLIALERMYGVQQCTGFTIK